jgi:hypothetical protein
MPWFVGMNSDNWDDSWRPWMPIMEVADQATAEKLREALGVGFGELGSYRSFSVRDGAEGGLAFAARKRMAMYARAAELVNRDKLPHDAAASTAHAECGLSYSRSRGIGADRFVEYYHFCLQMLESEGQLDLVVGPVPTKPSPPVAPPAGPTVPPQTTVPPWRREPVPQAADASPTPADSVPQQAAKVVSKDGAGDVHVNVHVPTPPPTVNVVIDLDKIAAAIERLAQGKVTTATTAEGKDSDGWTASKAEMAVEQFLKARKPLYMELLPMCVANEKEARAKFQAEFGPSAIAAKIGDGLLKGTVGKTPTYVKMIKPVISGKQPEGIDLPTGDDGTINDICRNMRKQAGGE